MNTRAHVFIYGDVTGVGFRAWTMRCAKELGLTGWVRNATYNCVEAIFEGEKKKVQEMITCCHRGPEVAWVKKVDVRWEKATNEFLNFDILI